MNETKYKHLKEYTHNTEDVLNELVERGWKVIHVHIPEGKETNPKYYFLLKREGERS